MAKFKKETSHNVTFAKGGNTPMFGKQNADDQEPGETSHDTNTSGAGSKFAEGGKGKMFGFTPSQPAQAGKSSAR